MVLVKDPEQTIHYMYCKLSSFFLHVSAHSQQQLWIGCSLYSLHVKIAYSDIESKLANHRFVNILAFESAIQVLNGLATNVRNPAPAVKIIRVRCVTHETSFLNAINCDWLAWCGSLLWLNYYCWMMSASLNHCKKIGARTRQEIPHAACCIARACNCSICWLVNTFLLSFSVFLLKEILEQWFSNWAVSPPWGQFLRARGR